MTCSRCSGFMLEDQFLDLEGAYGEMWASSCRCVNCSHTHDPVLERNRLAQEKRVLVISSGEPDDQNVEVYLGVETFIGIAA